MNTPKKHFKKKTGKIFLLSNLIDIILISYSITSTNMPHHRELSLGVLICFSMVSIESLNLDSLKNQVSTDEKLLTVSKPSLNSLKGPLGLNFWNGPNQESQNFINYLKSRNSPQLQNQEISISIGLDIWDSQAYRDYFY